jgi:DNA-binding GntR family transcriptional regulator
MEAAISEELGMSRTPIREAFRTLSAEGLVEFVPDRGVIVSELKGQAADVFLVLGELEALAGELACERITPEELETLAELQSDLESHFKAEDRRRYVEANRLIHELIVKASHNEPLIQVWRVLLPRAERARQETTRDPARWAEAFQEHRRIFSAVAARDAPSTKLLLAAHFTAGVAALKRSAQVLRQTERSKVYDAASRSGR